MARRTSRMMRRQRRKRPTYQVIQRKLVVSVGKAATDTGIFRAIALNDFPGASDLFSLYQDYKLLSLSYKYVCVTPNAAANFPTLYIAPAHFAKGISPSSRDEVLQYKNAKSFQYAPGNLSSPTYTFKPYVRVDGDGGFVMTPSPWLSTSTLTTQHLSQVEWHSRYSTLDPNTTIDCVITVRVAVRGCR